MVSRAVTQLYEIVLRPSGLRVTQVSILATIARLGEANEDRPPQFAIDLAAEISAPDEADVEAH